MSRAILYARVSSDEQNKGSSPDDQIRRCAEYARMQGFTVVAEIRDDFTGYEFERPGFDKVRDMIAKKEADTIVCLSGDRLARTVFVVGRISSEVLRRYRVNLHFVSRGRVDYDSPEGEFIMLMEAVGNQYWGTKAKEVMKNGRRALVQDGIKPGQGPTLYGYVKTGDRKETRYHIVESAAVIIRRIFKEIADGKAILAVARDLTEEGFPIPSQSANMQRGKRKDYGIWTPKILHRILKNEAYAGTLWLNRTTGTHGKDLQYNPREKWIPVPMPVIVDRALFDAAQQALAGHISVLRDGGAYRQTFLMAGIIRCEHCANRGRPGHNIVTPSMRRSRGRSYSYYICSKSLLSYLAKEERCPLPSVPRDKLDTAVWRFVEALYANPDAILASFQEGQQNAGARMQRRKQRLQTLNTRLPTSAPSRKICGWRWPVYQSRQPVLKQRCIMSWRVWMSQSLKASKRSGCSVQPCCLFPMTSHLHCFGNIATRFAKACTMPILWRRSAG